MRICVRLNASIIMVGCAIFLLLSSAFVKAKEVPLVVTTFTVLKDMAQNVAGDKLKVVSITQPNAEIHDYQPTPKDLLQASHANLILWNGLGLERWFLKFYQDLNQVPVAVLSQGIKPMMLTDGPYEGSPNPHAWISPSNAGIYIDNILKAFIKIDPANQAYYEKNAEAYKARLMALNAPIRDKLSSIADNQRQLVTCEGAFSYLARDYGFQQLYLWAVNSESEGTPQQIRKVVDGVRNEQVPVVFCESTVSDRAMKQVAKETGARFGGVLYVDSLSDPKGAVPTYESMLSQNAKTIMQGFGVHEKQ